MFRLQNNVEHPIPSIDEYSLQSFDEHSYTVQISSRSLGFMKTVAANIKLNNTRWVAIWIKYSNQNCVKELSWAGHWRRHAYFDESCPGLTESDD